MSVSISTNTMKSYWKSFLFILFAFTTTIISAQETCDNGVDDDGDGLIDCYDGECSDDGACEDFFFGNTVICADDIDVTTFAIREQWGSADETATSHVTPAIGDLDANGIPEVVTINNYGSLDLFVLNGATGATIASIDIGFTPENAPIIARVDGDEIGDIIVSQNKGDDLAMYNVDITTGTLTQIWRERASVNQSIGLPGVADFDEDGDVEIYYRNEVMDALTGTVIVAGDGNWEQDYTHGSIAVDVLPDAACADCAGLELVSGNEVWAINEAAGTRTLVADMDDVIHSDIDPNLNYYPKYYPSWDDQWSTVSAADYNLDGNIDVIITGALGTSTEKYNGETTIFFWDIVNQNVITYHDPTNDFVRGPGRVNIGDVDGDGQLNANFVMDQKLYSLDENFNVHWIHPIKEGSSGFTGCSLFDFDGDGAVEVVYRSEESLLIVDGVGNGDNTTSERREIACVSRTQEEYPVIADVDGDGSSEICVSCYTNNSTPFSPYSNTRYSQIRVYESDGEAWMPARGVWNQHGYYNVNINDDLTIPTEVQDHSVVFSAAGTCEYSDGSTIPFDNRPLNTFLNQAPILNEEGCVEFASPDIEFVGILSATDALCPDAEITVEYEIRNQGDIDISGSLPVSYYAGDPTTSAGVLLDTEVAALVNFEVGETLTITQTFTGIGGDFELFVVINDNGGTPPLTIPLPTAGIPECETGNNISSTIVGFQSFDLTVEKIFDNRKCVDSYVDEFGNTITVPDNGQARAYYFGPTPGNNETFWIENFEDRANGDKSDVDDTAWSSDPGTDGPSFYGVTSYNGSKMFNGRNTGTSFDEGIVTWTSEDIDISDHTDINVTLDIFENGNQESSGEWRDFVRVTYELRDNSNAVTESGQFIGGFQVGDFTYAQAFLANLNSDGADSLLIITAEIHNTSSSEYHYIDNISVSGTGPDIIAEFTEPDGFNFFWFDALDDDFSDTLSSSSTFAQMADGNYNVIGYYENTLCYSDTVAIEIQRVTPTVYVWAYEINPLTQCDTPDGSAGAFVYTQTQLGTFPANDTDNIPLDTLLVADGYEFNWRDNDDITNTYFATGNVIQDLLAKEFAVDVIDLQTRCTNTALVEVTTNTEAVNDPTVTITPIATCGGTGELSASVDGNTADYTFEWFDGNGVKPAVDHTGATYTVADAGSYTVRATSNSSSCPSDPVTVVMTDNANAPTPVATATAANTSCDAVGNGSVIADGDGAGTTAGYNFTWFRGNNTLPANEMPAALAGSAFGAGDHELINLVGGAYTVIVEDAGTLCTDTVSVTVPTNIVEPTYNFLTPINSGNALHVLDKSFIRIPQLLSSESAVTISFWVELSADNYANNHAFFSAGNNAETVMGLWADETEGISATITTDAGAASAFSNFSPVGWVNVAFTWDEATNLLQLIIDGVKVSEVSHPGPHGTGLDDGGTDMYFARDGNLGVNKFEGNVDEFRIYHRAIPENEILAAVCDPTSAASSPEVYYDFNSETLTGDGDPILDQSGNGNDGEIHLQAGSTVNFLAADYNCPLADVINNTSCDPGNPNGEIDMTNKVDPIGANYSYELYTGYGTSGTPTVNTSGIFSNLSDGFYTVVVTDLDTNCDTDPLNLSIASAPDNPIIATTPTDNTYCVDGDGTIFVTSQSGTTEPTSYTYEIFDGASFTTQIGTINIPDGTVGHTFDDLAGGTYRIRVTNDDTGCTSFVDEVVNSTTTTPLFGTPNVVNNTSCGAPNGFISVSIQGGNVSNYLFTWYDGDDSSDPVLVNGVLGENSLNSIDGDPAGRPYTVVAVDAVTGCPTAELTIDVYDDPFTPDVIIVEENPDTSCGVGNGTLRAYVTTDPDLPACSECVTNYTFVWSYNGVGPLATNDNLGNNSNVTFSGTNNSIISGLSADLNNYSVTATHNSLSCSVSETHILSEDETVPTVSLDTDQDNTFCTPANYDGFITVQVDDDGAVTNFTGYTFTWYNGSGASKTLNASSNSQTLGGINEGSYSVTVQTPSGCTSDTVTFSIVDALPTLGAGESGLTGNSVCDPALNDPGNPDANGAVTLTPTGGTGAGTFAFALETSGGTAIANDGSTGGYADVLFNNAAVTSTTVSGLPNGNYVMTITDENSGCSIDHPFAIGDATVDPTLAVATINANTTDNTSCVAGNFTGTATVALADITGAGAALADYSFFWATAADPATQIDDDNVLDDDISGNTGVEDGNYVLIVTDLITGCTSATANVTINSGQPTLGAGESGLTGNSVCDPALNDPGNPDANGAVTLTPTGGTGAGTFAFALETSGGTAIANDGSTGGYADVLFNNAAVTSTTVSGLPNGNYVMTITDENSGCSIDHPFAIGDATVDPTLAVATINANTTDNTSCVAGNFTGTATVALADITGAGAALADYSFFWATAADPATQIDDDNVLDDDISGNTGVEDGDYVLIVTDLITGCTSATANVTINSGQPTLGAGESGLTGNSVCDPALNDPGNPDANGAVTLTPTGGTGAGTFAFALETSGGTAIANDGSTGGYADVLFNNAAVTSTTVSGLPNGNYVMTITDENSGCSIDHPFAIGDATVDPTLAVATINANTTDNTSCVAGNFTGTATVALADITGAGAALTDYSFFWATAADPATQIDDDNVLDDDISGNTGVEDGDYVLIVTDLITGCTSATANVTINSGQPTLGAGESGLTGNSVCDPALNDPGNPDANGAVTLTPTGGTGAGTFAFALETSGGTAIANDGSTGGYADVLFNNAAVTSTTVSGLPNGNYVMTITDENSGCSIDHPFAIGDATVDPTLAVATINANTTDNTSCVAGNFTGTATVALADITGAGAALADYSFFWATAADPATQIDDDNVLDDDISGNTGVEDGNYVLIVTDLITGCTSATANVTINSGQPTLGAGESGLTGNSVCDPALNDPGNPDANGAVTLTPTGGTGAGTFAFALETSGGTAIANDGSTGGYADVLFNNAAVTSTTVSGLPNGNYVMTITDENSGCSIDHPFAIGDATVDPTLAVATINANTTDNTSCVAGNFTGTATVALADITGAGAALADYSFFWATAADPATQIDDDNVLDDDISGNTGVEDGNYVLIVTDLITGCTSATANVTINSGQPTLGAGESGLTGNSVCDPALNDPGNPDANGAVTLTPTGGTGAGTFAFALETSGGTAIANDGSTGGYADVLFNNAAVTSTTVSGLPNGNYVMTITDENSGCSIDHPFAIGDATVDPTLAVATINANTTDNTSCVAGNFTGTATVALADITGAGAALTDYSFFWATAADPATQIDDDNVLDDDISGNTGVEDGNYVLIVTDLITGCTSATANVTINSGQPTLGAGESGLTGNSVCDPALNDPGNPDANGAVTLTPTGGTGAGTFAFALETSGGTAIANDGSTGGYADVLFNNAAVTSTTVSGLPNGNYVMTITDENSGCSIDHPFAIGDATVDPTLAVATINANTTDNTSCDPNNYTGTATVALADITGAGAALTDYSFFWATAADPATQIDDDNVLDDDISGNTGVEDGNYVLIVTDLITGCTSATANVTIGINLPTITPSTQVLQDNFSCDVSNPIGSATLTVAEGPNTNYSFEWFVGTSPSGSPFDTDDQIDNQLHGTYTVRVTDNATLCTNTAQVVIGEFVPTLTVGASSSVDHSDCYPSNGQVSVTPSLSFNPAGPPTGVSSSFTYQWYFGTSATAGNELLEGIDPGNLSNPTNVNTNTVTGLSAGDYTVVISETQTGCVSAIETVTIADEVSPYKPTIAFTKDIIPSSCDGDNGRITAEITALGVGAPSASGGGLNFTFEWYEGAQDYATLETTGSAAALLTGEFLVANPSPGNSVIVSDNGDTNVGGTTTLDQIVSGLYTVVMIDQATGCRYFETVDLGFSGQQVTTTLTIDNVTQCPDNGAARVGLADNIILTVSPQSGQFTIGESFTAAPSGATGIIGADQLTGEVQVTLDDLSPALAVADVLTGVSSTETATITAINNVGYATGLNEFDDISQYTVFLYAGNGVPADRFAPYTFEGRVFPYSYNPATGARLDGNGDPLASGAGPTLNAGDEAEFPDLPAGDYIAIAQEINNPAFNPGSTSNCWTAASVDEEILDLAFIPIIQSSTSTNNTNCDITAGNGALSLTVIEDPEENNNPPGDQQPNGYRFTWIRDLDAFTVLTEDILTETATSNPTNLNPGDYTVTIQRLGGAGNTPNNCEVSTTLTVGHNPEQHEITNATVSPNQDCSPLDGSIVVNDADITDNAADYQFTWYSTYIDPGNGGNVLLADAFVDGGLNNGDQGANSVSGLVAGTYYVEALHVAKTCETPVFEIEVEDQTVTPTFTVAQTAQDIVCDDATFTPTGQATLTITNGSAAPADYTISWFEDAAETQPLDGSGVVAAPAFSVNNSVVDQLPAGTYFVRIEDNTTPGDGCISVQQSVTIEQFNTTISVGATVGVDFNISASDDCAPDNGSFEILDISETRPGGTTVSISGGDYAIGDYTFDWFANDGVTPLADALVVGFNNGDAGASQVAGLAPDTYYLQITNVAAANGTGCAQAAADFIEFVIEDQTVTPTFTVAQTAQDIVCDDATFTPTGQATLTITNGSAAPADYTISWFEDAAETQPLDGSGVVAAPAFSVNNSVVDQLPAGTYFVRIEDNTTPGDGCISVQQSVTIEQFNTTISVGATVGVDFNISASDDCAPDNGSFEILDISETRPGGTTVSISGGDYAIGDYTFDWFANDGVTPLADALVVGFNNGDAGASQVAGLAPDTYYLQITNVAAANGTGCAQAAADFIEFVIEDQTVTPTFTVAQTAQDIVCDDATFTPTGQATLTITNGSAAPADYTISWFEDAAETQPLDGSGVVAAPAFSVNNSVVDQLPAGTYFVRIEDNTTPGDGCISVQQSVTIEQFNTTISVGATVGVDFNISASDDCAPDNGSFEILDISETRPGGTTVSISGGDYAIGDYTFDWFANDGVTPLADALVVGFNNGDAGASQVAGLAPDTYYLQITNVAAANGTGCAQAAADFIEFVIEDQTVTPTFTVAQTAQDIVCDDATFTPTGQATLTITNGSAAPADYTISWFEDAAETQPLDGSGVVAAPAFSVNNSVVDQLPAGTYFVRIEDNTTPGDGCISVQQSVTIEQFNTTISVGATVGVDFNISASDDCAPDNGSFEILDISETRPGGTTVSISGGDYAIGDYTFDWFANDGVTPLADALVVGFNNGDAGASQVAGLAPDTYYLQITNVAAANGTGCAQAAADFIEFVIEDQTVTPTFTVAQTAQDIVCDDATFTPTGQATLTITNGSAAPADYTISWFEDAAETQPLDGSGVVAAPAFSVNNSVVDQLPAGTYFVRIEDNTTPGDGCISVQQSVTIEQFNTTISVGATVGVDFNISASDDCAPDNGSFEILDISETRPGGTTVSISGGDYAIGDYTFDWFANDGVTPLADALVVGFNNGDAGASQVAGLAPDTYYLQITNVAAANGTGCAQAAADFIEFVIEDQTVTPTFTVAQTAQDIVCDDATFTPTGQATLTITNGSAAPADYTISWFEDAAETQPLDGSGVVAAPAFSVNNSVVDQLPAGTYFVRIEDNTTPGDGCISVQQSVTIEQFNTTISVGATVGVDFNISASDDCAPDNGSFEILDISETRPGGTTVSISGGDYAIGDYTFDWFANDGVTPLADALVVGFNNGDAGASQVAGLAPDTYYLQITNVAAANGTGCAQAAADFIEFVIEDQTVTPTFTVAQTAQDIVCDDATFTPTGQATLTITNGSAAPADYTISWFEDAAETQPLDGSGVVAAPAFSVNNSVVDQLPAGTYFVRIEDNTTPGDGCISVQQSVTIEQFNTTISVGATVGVDFNISASDDCAPDNGSFEILDISETRPGGTTVSISGGDYAIGDYTFDWFANDGVTPLADALVVGFNNGDAGASQVAGLAPDTYYLQITNVAAANGTGCAQAAADFIEFVIEDQTVDPIINLTGLAIEDTYCDNTGNVGDGSLSISITDDGVAGTPTDFTITWYRGTISGANEIFPADGGSRGSATANGTLTTLSDLATGDYTVVINKDLGDTPGTGNSGCTTTAVFNVGSNSNIPTIDVSTIQSNTEVDSLCVGSSGTLIINDADIDGNLDDYLIEIRQGSAVGGHVGASPYLAGTASPTITINGLSADDYYIIATNDVTGCSAATAVINVKDSVRNPQISLVSVTPNEDCGGGIIIGGLEVIIDNVYDENDHFNVQWFTGSGAVGGNEIVAANSVVLSGVTGGPYSVEIENTNTGCISTKDFTIPTQDEALFITNYEIDNVSYCVDNGSFAVKEISFGGVNIDSAQMVIDGIYDLEVYTTPGDLLSGVTGTNPNEFVIESLGIGSYYAIIRKTDSQCESDPIFFDIEENIILPDVIITVEAADSTCTALGTAAGSLSAEADGNDDTNADYTFEWFSGSGVGSPLGITTSTITGLSSGTYTVRVTYIPSGCTQLAELEVPSVPADLEILAANASGATSCTPPNGTITVTDVSTGLITDYNFDYYDSDPTVGGATPVFTGVAGAAYTTAAAGTYWIIGTHVTLDCTTEPFQITVNDNTILPELSLDDFDFQANCDPSNPNGRLLVLADGQPENATFDFEWYFGTGTGNPLTSDDYTGGGNLTGESTNEVSGIAAGFYTVEVTNLTTGCVITETYEMVDNIPNPIAISTSTSANTSCVNPNGKAAVSVISPAPGRSIIDYNYYWFIGDIAAVGTNPNPANADYTGTLIEGIADGPYVVLVIDQIDNFCQSNAVEVNVEDGTSRPQFELTTSDVTVCFDEKDGFASVTLDDLSSVDIAWYDDTNSLIGTSFFVDHLDAGNYRLLLTHVITGCTSEQNFDIFNNAVTPSDPFVLVNNGRTNCQFANGSAIANVDGVTNNYLFEWFDPSDMTTPYATGSEVFNLDTTTYLVRATNLATGCESAFTSVDIGYEVEDPVYDVIFNNSVCLRTEDGSTNQFTGTAIISFEEFQLASDYEWRDASGAVVGNDSRLIDAYPGDYTVTFTAENGCSYSASFTIETSLTIYNGVSANGDGKNDFFLVDCIDYFPNNNLQVFNRAGQKVYDIDGYNNTSIRFEGISNVGSGGLQLPAGTYFYVIDLGNGEDPVQGYLELVR